MSEEQYKGYVIKIEVDDCATDPSEWGDGILITHMAGSRYILGNTPVSDPVRWRADRLAELRRESPKTKKADLMFEYPVYALVHSGVALSMHPFSCPWDSGQSGVISISRKQAKECFPSIRTRAALEAKVRELLAGFLKTFNQYISGEVYSYTIEDPEGESIDSCGGFYGMDYEASGLLETARDAIDSMRTQAEELTTEEQPSE